jgi:hypothetical protein
MTQSMTKLGRATRAGALTAMLAIAGMTAAMASAKTARAWDHQASEATVDDDMNRQVARPGSVTAPRPGPYASARRDRHVELSPAARKDFQDQ